jgi:hypothetical protein
MAVSDNHKLSFWSRRWLAVASTRAPAVADQAVVSGTSFLTTAMIARWALPDDLGIYAMAISLLVSWVVVQESLVLLIYTIHRHRPQATSTEHAGSYLALSGLFSMLAIAMFSMAAHLHRMVWWRRHWSWRRRSRSRHCGNSAGGLALAHLRVLQSLMLDLAASAGVGEAAIAYGIGGTAAAGITKDRA